MIMATTNNADPGLAPPHKGDKFRCDGCGMKIEVTVDCKCKEDEHVHFHCCGKEMVKD